MLVFLGQYLWPGWSYSHLCGVPTCWNPMHGVWEKAGANNSRFKCMNSSHVIGPDGTIQSTSCPHKPACLRGTKLDENGHSTPACVGWESLHASCQTQIARIADSGQST